LLECYVAGFFLCIYVITSAIYVSHCDKKKGAVIVSTISAALTVTWWHQQQQESQPLKDISGRRLEKSSKEVERLTVILNNSFLSGEPKLEWQSRLIFAGAAIQAIMERQ
jgi:hypothetical protein